MTVPSWRVRPDTILGSRVDDPRGRSRKRRLRPDRSAVEQLETRQLLTFSATLAGSTATFTVGNTTDSVIFSKAGANLQHNALTAPLGETFADNADFDSIVAGSQNLADAAGSTVDVQGTAYTATIGTPSSPAGTLLSQFNLSGGPATVTVDDSASTSNTDATLIATGATSAKLTNIGTAAINLETGAGDSLKILAGKGTNTQTIDFSANNPISLGGLTYTGGGGANTLILQGTEPGGGFNNETVNATGAGAGDINLDGTTIAYTGLKPIIDTALDVNFTFNYTGGLDGRISVGAGAAVGGTATTLISSASATSQFEQVAYANKTNVTINAGTGNDVVSVAGAALLAGSNTTIDGQAGTNVLNYDAGGSSVVIAPTGTPGQATITRAGSGSLLVMNFSQINVVNGQIQGVPVTTPTITAAAPLKGIAGIPLTHVDVATFTAASTNTPGSSFAATINWGDGTSTAGTIVPDASNPAIFHVEGSHTYSSFSPAGGFAIQVSVSETQGNTTIIPGVTLTQANVGTVGNTATISDAVLTATGAALSAVAGQPLTQALVANFTYAGGLVPLTNFSGTISWGDGTPPTAFNSSNISVVGTSTAGTVYRITQDHTFPNFGTFPVSVTINSAGGSSAIAQGAAVVSDSPIMTTPTPITATEGVAFSGTVASFTDPAGSAANLLALITWGDGHVTQGTVTAGNAPNTFDVSGTNTYAKAGSYSATVSIRDTAITGGSTATIAVPVTVNGAAITSATLPLVNDVTVLQPFTDLVGTFRSANPFATAADFAATVDWGDGTPPTSGLIGQDASGNFSVTGSHVYTTPRPATNPYPVSVTVKELASTSPATPIGGVPSVVLDALLTAQGATVSAVEGTPLTGALVSSLTYAGGGAVPVSNFSGTVDWGDGSSPAAFTLVPGTPVSGVSTYLIKGDHTFSRQGTFPVTVTINSGFGSVAVAHSTAVVTDALTVTVVAPAPVENLAFDNQTIATFRDAGTAAPASKYSATINWGDGTAIVPGTIVANADGSFSVLSSHTYNRPGVFPLTVTVTNDLSGETSGTANVTVTPAALNLVGHLNPASDTGQSNTDAITKDTRPNFYGTATPGTIVTLFAIPVGTSTLVQIGSTVTDGSGAWSITSITLADGKYTIQAVGTDPAGVTRALDVILPNPLQGPLVVDTVAPKVDSVLFEPLTGNIAVSFQDDRSGMDGSEVINGANYSFVRTAPLATKGHPRKGTPPLPSSFLITGISTTPQVDPTAPQDVLLTLNGGDPIRGGFYRFTIRSGGIEDIAGNALDGEFYGFFPSGNNKPGGDFVANLTSIHNTVLAPQPVDSSASPLTPPGVLPAATFIPTVEKVIVRNGKRIAVLANGQTLAAQSSKSQATKASIHVGKPTPHATLAVKAHAPASKAARHHG